MYGEILPDGTFIQLPSPNHDHDHDHDQNNIVKRTNLQKPEPPFPSPSFPLQAPSVRSSLLSFSLLSFYPSRNPTRSTMDPRPPSLGPLNPCWRTSLLRARCQVKDLDRYSSSGVADYLPSHCLLVTIYFRFPTYEPFLCLFLLSLESQVLRDGQKVA